MATQGTSGSASGGQLEEKLDLTPEVDAAVQAARDCVASLQLAEALTILAGWEKKCRAGNDAANLVRLCTAAVTACHDCQDAAAVVTTITTWATKRSQKSTAISALVTTALPWCVDMSAGVTLSYKPIAAANESEAAVRDTLVVTLRDITDGKLFLERERAQLTRVWATIQESKGDVGAAADILQEVHVETYGSLSKKEKVEFILEQMRLTVLKQDFIRSSIVAGKVNRKHLAEMPEYKIRFYTLLATVHRHEQNALELVKDYHAVYSTLVLQQEQAEAAAATAGNDMDEGDVATTTEVPVASSEAWKDALKAVVVFLALSPFGNERQDILLRVSQDERLEKLPEYHTTIQMLLKKEIITYPLAHQAELEGLAVVQDGDLGAHWHDVFFRRIIQHNIQVVALYYTRIHGARLAQLLNLTPDVLEQEIASMVSDGTIFAKIDRPADIVRFQAKQSPESILTSWVTDIDELLHLVEKTTHLIHKEQMTAQ